MIKKPSLALIFPMVLVLYEIVNYLSNDMYLPALPQMMRSLNLAPSDAQLTLMWWFLGLAIAPLFMGLLADHYGRRPVLIWGGVIYIVASFFLHGRDVGPVVYDRTFFSRRDGGCHVCGRVCGHS